MNTKNVGTKIRSFRKAQSVTQAELAGLCGVGIRFISDLENGKPTIELGKALHVLHCLGLDLSLTPRSWKSIHSTQQGES